MSETGPANRRGLGLEAFGGAPVGNLIALPRGAQEPIRVYVNGVEQVRGEDYDVLPGRIVFREPIYKEQLQKLTPLRKLALGLGLIGWYERNEVVDIEYRLDGRTKLVSDAKVLQVDSAP
jgi:hypothetical protein